ncbi:cryptochrome/photolyase family protein, partial [Candidatus Poribacteria bacterium]|nr:cryptochrome/photolyase family protein [Candidatus Poribacteria bacterium]
MSRLIVLMPEHLTRTVSSLRAANPKKDSIVFIEPTQDWSKENHHKKKIIYHLSSMRHFAADLVEEGFNVEYLKIEDKKNSGILEVELEQVVQSIGCERV